MVLHKPYKISDSMSKNKNTIVSHEQKYNNYFIFEKF